MRKLIFISVFFFCYHNIYTQTIVASGPTSYCQGDSVTLSVTGATGNPTYQWTLNGGNITSATNSILKIFAAGTYNVIYTQGNSQTLNDIIITVYSKPDAAFTFTPNNLCAKTPIQFTNTSTGSGLTYDWNFGDPSSGTNNTSTVLHPVHQFVGTAGNGTQNFTVTLITTSVNGCKDTATATVTMNKRPDATLGGTGATVYNGANYFVACTADPASTFIFNNLSTTTATNTNYTIVWGDNTPNFTQSNFTTVNHTYSTGFYTLLFIVTGTNNCIDTSVYSVFIGSNPGGSISSPSSTLGCTGTTFSFPFSNIQNNPQGTTYKITVNDGSTTVTYNQANVPAAFTHIFTNSSCGVSPNNTFTISYLISNPCGETPGTIGGIRISGKPQANFTISPNDTVCISTLVTLTNTGTAGSVVSAVGVGPCTPGKSLWSISPSIGWSLSSGSLGNDNNQPLNANNWTSGSTVVGLTFSTPGTYVIKLKNGNGSCGLDSIIKTICVNAIPVAAFVADNISGCAPLNVVTTNNTNNPTCGQNTYQWTVTYSQTAGCSPSTAGYSFTNGTNANSINPQFQFTNPGVYTISLRAFAPGGSCTTLATPIQITVKGKPVVNLNNPATTCVNQSITPTATSTCYMTGATYVWSFPGGNPSSANTLIPGIVVYNTAGTYTISLTVTNECGSTTVSNQITVNNAPGAPTVNNNGPLCSGNTLNLNASSSTPGVTYSWTGPGFTSTLQNPIRTNMTIGMSGLYTVTISLNGCSVTANTTVVVNQTPTNPVATSPINYCQNATANPLTATASAGNTLNWYTVTTGGTPSTTAPTPNTSMTGTTTYYVSQINNTTPACESGRSPIVVNVTAVPNINGSSTDPTTCSSSNGTITINGLAPNTTYTIQYVKNGGAPTTVILTSNASGTIVITNLSGGIYTNITASLNGCVSNMLDFTLVNPAAPAAPSANNNGPLCSGSTLNLTANSASSGATYSWTGPGGFTSTSQNPVRPNVTTAISGTYSVTVTLNGCTSAPATTNVTIIQTPTAPTATSPVNYCQGAVAIPLTATATPGNNLNWYTVATGGIPSTTPPTPNTSIAGTITYYVSQLTNTTPACEGARTPIVVNVYAVPNITGNYTDPTNCLIANGSITISGLTPNTVYSIQYVKDGGSPTTLSLTSNGSGTIVISNLSAGSYANITATIIGCSSNPLGAFVLTNPSAPSVTTIGNNGPLCSGSTLNLNSTSSTSGVTYSWNGPNGFTSTQQNPVRPNATTAMSGTYTLIITSNGCTSTPATTNVTIIQTPTAPVVSSPVNYCQNATALTLTATGDPNNLFNWYSSPTGGTSSTTAPTPNTTVLGSTTYYVSQYTNTNPACESGRTAIVVNIYAVPSINATFINPNNCLIANGSITISGLSPTTTYNLQYFKDGGSPTLFSAASNASGNIVISNLGVGTYSNITVTLNGCSSNAAGPFTLVNPTAPVSPSANSNGPLCSGNTLNLSAASSVTGVTYTWTGPNGFISSQQNPVRPNSTTSMNGDYLVTVTLNGCTSSSAATNVLINQTPNTPLVTSPINYCQNATASQLTAAVTPGNTLKWYTAATGGSASANAPTPSTSSLGTTTYYVSQQTNTSQCESARTPIVASINAIPSITVAATLPSTCSSSDGTITLSGLNTNTSYTVQYTNNGINISGALTSNNNGNIILNNLPAGTYSNITAILLGCTSNSAGPFTLVNPSGPSTPTTGSNSPLCPGRTLSLTATSSTSGVSYSWIGPNGFTSSLQNPSIPNFRNAMSGRYYVFVSRNNCMSQKDSVDVIINADPIVDLGPDLTLAPATQHLMTSTIQNGPITQYVWAPSTNLSCVNCPDPIATIQSNISYTLRVTNINGCVDIDTVNIIVTCDKSQVYIPNGFSPDGDGVNDLFVIRSAGIVTIKYFRVFNKWGELIFEQNNFSTNDFSKAWNGRIKGVLSPPDVFVYTTEIMCENGTSFLFKGNITLIR